MKWGADKNLNSDDWGVSKIIEVIWGIKSLLIFIDISNIAVQ